MMPLLLALGFFVLGFLANDGLRWLRNQSLERRRLSERWRR